MPLARETMTLQGGRDLERKLIRLADPRLAKKLARRALRGGAKVIAPAVKSEMDVVTGDMRRSVKVRSAKLGRSAVARAWVGINVISSSKDGDKDYHTAFNEYGTSRQAPDPAFRRGFDKSKRAALNAIMAVLRQELNREARK